MAPLPLNPCLIPIHKNPNANNRNRNTFLHKALEQFLGKTRSQIEHTILQTLEGHLRAILGTLDVETIYKDRDSFARLVREVAAPDVAKMGLEILSFTIKVSAGRCWFRGWESTQKWTFLNISLRPRRLPQDVTDNVQHLESLGVARTAEVKRDADVARAETSRDAGIAVRCPNEGRHIFLLRFLHNLSHPDLPTQPNRSASASVPRWRRS